MNRITDLFTIIKDTIVKIDEFLRAEFRKRNVTITRPENSYSALEERSIFLSRSIGLFEMRFGTKKCSIQISFQTQYRVRIDFSWPIYPSHDKFCRIEFMPLYLLEDKDILDRLASFLNENEYISSEYDERRKFIEDFNILIEEKKKKILRLEEETFPID